MSHVKTPEHGQPGEPCTHKTECGRTDDGVHVDQRTAIPPVLVGQVLNALESNATKGQRRDAWNAFRDWADPQ